MFFVNNVDKYGFAWGPFGVLFSVEQHEDGIHWHLSVSHQERYPSWDELMAFRACLFDDNQEVIQVLPSAEEYINVHNRTFHLWHKTGSSIVQVS
jgi:hypothetical protein